MENFQSQIDEKVAYNEGMMWIVDKLTVNSNLWFRLNPCELSFIVSWEVGLSVT